MVCLNIYCQGCEYCFQRWERPVWECCGQEAMACGPCVYCFMCIRTDIFSQGCIIPNCLCGSVGCVCETLTLPISLVCDVLCIFCNDRVCMPNTTHIISPLLCLCLLPYNLVHTCIHPPGNCYTYKGSFPTYSTPFCVDSRIIKSMVE